jgi:hypothetical protein
MGLTMAARTNALARFGRRVAGLVAECNYAQRRALALRTTPDALLADRDEAPDNYPEFLFRTSSPLLHEPAAAGRAHGQPVG